MIDTDILNIQYNVCDLGTNLKDVRNELESLELDKGINILALQPGVGKTHKIKQILEKNSAWLITVPNYKLIDNEYNKIIKMKGVSYWKGFDYKCSRYRENDRYIQKLRDTYKLNPSIICTKCNQQNKCDYKKQFKNSKKVVTSSAFYNTPYFYDKGKFKFKIAIIDEELRGYEEIKLNETEIDKSLNKIYDVIDYPEELPEFDYRPNFGEIIKEKHLFSEKNKLETDLLYLQGIEDDQKAAINIFTKEENWKDLNIAAKLDISKIKKWLYYYAIYKENRVYGEPNIYKLFDLARQGVKVIFSDATFNETIFKALLNRYEHEDNKIPRKILLQRYEKSTISFESPKLSNEIPIKIFKSSIQDKNFGIFRMGRQNKFTRGNISTDIEVSIKQTLRKYSEIGIISYKKDKDRTYKNRGKESIQFDKYGEFLYFGNLRGTNSFKNKDIVFIIGTPYPGKKFIEDYNALFIKSEDKEIKVELDSKASDELNIEEYQRYLIESELYQATHRIRPFENPDKKIYIFGHLTTQLKKEFKVVYLDHDLTHEYFQEKFKGVYPKPLFGSLQNYSLKNSNLTVNDIAKEYKLYKNQDKKDTTQNS